MEKYLKNLDFIPFRKNSKYLLLNSSNVGVEVDPIIHLIWGACEGASFEEIYDRVNEVFGVSWYLLKVILYILEKAGLVSDLSKESEAKKGEPQPYPDFLSMKERLVSIVVVNRNGKHHLRDCLDSIYSQTHRQLEVIMVDTASNDGSKEFVKTYYPKVKMVELSSNDSFARGNNLGIAQAKGEYILLLNNDTKLDERCLEELLRVAELEGRDSKGAVAAIQPKIKFFYLKGFINSLGNCVGSRGWGSDNYIGYIDVGQLEKPEELFSACFGAILLRREALEKVGLLDEKYNFYYEDSDWSYRARLQGYRILSAPKAVVYHKFGASMSGLSWEFKLNFVAHNRLRFAFKNLSIRFALRFFKGYLLEDGRNFLSSLKHLRAKQALTYLRAWLRFLFSLPFLLRVRQKVQSRRLPDITDEALFQLGEVVPPPQMNGSYPLITLENVRRYYSHLNLPIEGVGSKV